MNDPFEDLLARADSEVKMCESEKELDELRVLYLGKKGKITALMKGIGSLPREERPAFGAKVNGLRSQVERLLEAGKTAIWEREIEKRVQNERIDVTLPGEPVMLGGLHPLTRALRDALDIFYSMGFRSYESREAETDEMNFVNLNIPSGHPARDMQDTLYLTDHTVLRTHTSPGQIRGMLELGGRLPVRLVVPGRTYRRDAADASHSPVFHQVEGLALDENVTFRHLKGVLGAFARQFFGQDVKIRLRPSYFPFTEPSAELDISCLLCRGKGCPACKTTGWMEVAGCGMVHPTVIRNGGYDPHTVGGFAFGFGLDRVAMLKYGITDMRVLFQNDLRFLSQWEGV